MSLVAGTVAQDKSYEGLLLEVTSVQVTEKESINLRLSTILWREDEGHAR